MNEREAAARALALMDLTLLGDSDSEADVERLCRRAFTPHGHPAAVCIHARFVPVARRALREIGLEGRVAVATVANFPAGEDDTSEVTAAITAAVADGADEIDVVLPWRALRDGEIMPVCNFLCACRGACGKRVFKVILETGALESATRIRQAAALAINAGADFLKTSTGKTAVGATPKAARILLESIRDSGRDVGCKISGGIGTTGQAASYLDLAVDIMGADWMKPRNFRIGASGLLDDLLAVLDRDPVNAAIAKDGDPS